MKIFSYFTTTNASSIKKLRIQTERFCRPKLHSTKECLTSMQASVTA